MEKVKIPYEKPPCTIEDQAKLLKERGLKGDEKKLCDILRYVNYYRISGFLYAMRKHGSDSFSENASIEKMWNLYTFDRRLRGLFFECISRLEIALRTQIAYEHTIHTKDPFCHIHAKNFDLQKNKTKVEYKNMSNRISDAVKKARDSASQRPFVKHFSDTYTNKNLPIWMTIELVDFGVISHYFRLLPKLLRIKIAKTFGVTDKTLILLLTILNRIRNKCAHHERLIFANIPTKGIKNFFDSKKNTKLTNLEEAIKDESDESGITLYCVASIMAHMLSIIRPESHWKSRIRKFMLDPINKESRAQLPGFANNKWESCALWRE